MGTSQDRLLELIEPDIGLYARETHKGRVMLLKFEREEGKTPIMLVTLREPERWHATQEARSYLMVTRMLNVLRRKPPNDPPTKSKVYEFRAPKNVLEGMELAAHTIQAITFFNWALGTTGEAESPSDCTCSLCSVKRLIRPLVAKDPHSPF